jgi:AraC-like DNA-binding protein
MESHHPTVTLRFSQAIRQAAGRLGIALPVAGPDSERVPLETQDALWEAFCSASQEPLIGLQLGLELQAGHLDLAGLLLMSCETYGESLEALLEYYPIVGEGGDFSIETDGDEVRLSYLPHYHVRVAERVENVMAALLNLSHWNSGGAFRASRIEMSHGALDQPERYTELLRCPVQFGCHRNSICFSGSLLSLPLIQANAAMRDQLRRLADEKLSQLGDDSLARQVADLICKQPRWGKERIAEHFSISGRHLIRLLTDEGLTFKQIRDRELLRLAQQALQEGIRITDVAIQLGFSDESAFAKAFRRWTGMSPAQYRHQQH